MRIISGTNKGRSLKSTDGLGIRPTTDRTKEGIFNIISHKIHNAKVLDLFSGSGALGIECISRGCAEVVFCDINKQSIEIIKENLKGIEGNYQILNFDFKESLKKLEGQKFDLIFLDPPYSEGFESEILLLIEKFKLLSKDGIIILERAEKTDYNLTLNLAVTNTKKYSKSVVDIIEKKTKCIVTGTFDPFTKGHEFLVAEALKLYDIAYIVIFINPLKKNFYSLTKRLEFVSIVTKKYKNRALIDFSENMVIDYCKKKGIKDIIRGYRNEEDFQYECEMSDFNKQFGNCETHIIKSENDISSTRVRELLLDGKIDELEYYVDKKIIKKLKMR